MKPLGVGSTYLLTFQIAGDEPMSVIGRYWGQRAMLCADVLGHAFEVGKTVLVLTEAAIVGDPQPSPMDVASVA